MSLHPSPSQGQPPARRRRGLRAAVLTAALTTAVATTGIASAGVASAGVAAAAPAATSTTGSSAAHPAVSGSRSSDALGQSVIIFDPSMPTAAIQARVDAIARQQVSNQFGTQRYSLLFEPGTYGSAEEPLIINVGYYTEVAGLGRSPKDVTINGHVDVYNQCLPTAPGAATNCIALINFWRSVSNLTIDVTGGAGCRAGKDFWAVSQAAPMRRVAVKGGDLSVFDPCTSGPNWSSGGFIADSDIAGTVINGSQQQFMTRDSSIGSWSGASWNQVFAGVVGAPAQSFPKPPFTTLATTPASKEKPYLYLDHGKYSVFVPEAREHSRGTTWQNGRTAGRSVPLSHFYVAHPGDRVATINAALARGKDLLFTPGVYDVGQTIRVERPDTVVLGLGMATLTPQGGVVPMAVGDVKGVDVAGLIFDAGPVNSPVLLQVGRRGSTTRIDESDPTALQDVFFRLGGPHVGKATVSLEVNLDETLVDDTWAWRADHGNPGTVGWTVNTGDTGVVVNGANVTATGLFVEHYQKYDTIWNGEGGRTVFYQNEMPYDAPNQAAWRHDGVNGWAAYKVADTVRTHEAWGLGSYIFTNVDPTLHATNAFEVPKTRGVTMHDLLTVELSAGTIDHVINGTGAPVTSAAIGVPSFVVRYPAR